MTQEERLQSLSNEDREVVENGIAGTSGHIYKSLYNGVPVFPKEERNIQSFLIRTALYADDNKEQMSRVFKSSGLYEETMTDETVFAKIEEAINVKAKIMEDINALFKQAN